MMSERSLLEWLSKEDWSAYGECRGAVLDALHAQGLVRYAQDPPTDRTGVALTEAGRARLNAERDA